MPDAPLTPNRRPARGARLAGAPAAGALAAAVGVALGVVISRGQHATNDFLQHWLAGRALLGGFDAYAATAAVWPWGYVYPLPAALVTLPLAALPPWAAFALFTGAGCGALAYGLAARGEAWRLIGLASGAGVAALVMGQWSPLLAASALVPALGWLWVVKPTTGLAALAYRPTPARLVAAAALCVAALAVDPEWPWKWLAAARALEHVRAPIGMLTAGGPLLALAALRWRRPEVRLLLALACVPQTMGPVDVLPLLVLVPATRREALGLAVASALSVIVGHELVGREVAGRAVLTPFDALEISTRVAAPLVLAATYLPCLALVLRRPNEGTVPGWLAPAAGLVRAWWAETAARGPLPGFTAGHEDDTALGVAMTLLGVALVVGSLVATCAR